MRYIYIESNIAYTYRDQCYLQLNAIININMNLMPFYSSFLGRRSLSTPPRTWSTRARAHTRIYKHIHRAVKTEPASPSPLTPRRNDNPGNDRQARARGNFATVETRAKGQSRRPVGAARARSLITLQVRGLAACTRALHVRALNHRARQVQQSRRPDWPANSFVDGAACVTHCAPRLLIALSPDARYAARQGGAGMALVVVFREVWGGRSEGMKFFPVRNWRFLFIRL